MSEDNYLLKSLTKACKLQNDIIVHRLPISKGVLKLIIDSIRNIHRHQPFLSHLYSAKLAAAYYGLLRISKVAAGPHAILVINVHIGQNKDKILFTLMSSKTHNKGNKPQLVKISSKLYIWRHCTILKLTVLSQSSRTM